MWKFVDCFSLVIRKLRKITRQFNVSIGLCVGVLAMWARLECDALVGLCELLARSKLAIKSLIGGAMNPLGLRHTILQSH
nr:MAG TPA: hypothetical protein [Caudoviricetes sp.]